MPKTSARIQSAPKSVSSIIHRGRHALLLCAPMFVLTVAGHQAGAQMQAPPIGGTSTLSSAPQPTLHSRSQTPGGGGSLSAVPDDFSTVTLGPGYLLDMEVYDMPEISGQIRVDNNGDITVPMAGTLHVQDMTVSAAHDAIEAKLKSAEILKDPKISLDVLQYAATNVTVLGEVQQPGRIQLLAPHSLSDVLAMAGGETITAGDTVQIRHLVSGHFELQTVAYARSKNTPAAEDIVVRPGDTVTVPRAGIVYVMGGVNRPGGYVMQEDGQLDAAQALSLAYGTTMNAAIGSIRIVHKNPDGTLTQTPVKFREITSGKAVAPMLQAEDILYVPISKTRTILTAGFLSSTSSALIYLAK